LNFSSLGPHTDENESTLKKAFSEKASTLLSTLLKKTKKLKTEETEEKDDDDKEGRGEEGPAAHKVPIPMGDETEYIKLKLVGQYSNEIHFLVKRTTQMGKLKKAYSERVGVPVTSLRFLLDGRRITDSEPVSALVIEMEANDVITVYQEQYGGYL
jgi:small ubiquitin-related modifier